MAKIPVLNLERISILAFVLLNFYLLIGAFPLVPVFGDGLGIANGAKLILEHGIGNNPVAYNYSQHCGVYLIISGISYTTKIDPIYIFLIISIISSLIFIYFSALLIRQILHVSFAFAGIMILLFQESYSSAYYANSNVVAGSIAIVCLWILSKYKTRQYVFLSGIFFGIAILMRLDSIILIPPAIVLIHSSNLRNTIQRILIFSFSCAFVSCLGLLIAKFNISDVLNSFSVKSGLFDTSVDWQNTFLSHIAFFSLLTILLILTGLWAFVKNKRWKNLLLIFSAILPTYLIYSSGFDTSRYLFYTVPFFALCATAGLQQSWRIFPISVRFAWIIVIMLAFILQYPLGIREIHLNASGWSRLQMNTGLSLRPNFKLVLLPRPVELINLRHNGGRLSSGLLFAPIWHHRFKLTNQKEALMVDQVVEECSNTIIVSGWTPYQLIISSILNHGYSLVNFQPPLKTIDRHTYFFSNGVIKIKLIYLSTAGIQRVSKNGFSTVIPETSESIVSFVGPSYIVKQLQSQFPKNLNQIESVGSLSYFRFSMKSVSDEMS